MPAQRLQPEGPSDDTQWHLDRASGALVAFWGRLDNRESLQRRWGPLEGGSPASDAAWVARGWSHEGPACPAALVGDFALAVVDPAGGRLLLARDPMGVRPLCYQIDDAGIRVASSLALLRRLMPAPPAPDPDWMLRYLVQLSWHASQTAYPGLQRLPPGHSLLLAPGRMPELRAWFEWRDDAPAATQRDSHWVEAYRALLAEAVRCRIGAPGPVGTESSSGLDSSAVTALLAQQVPQAEQRLLCLGLATSDEEARTILGLSRSLQLRHNHVLTRQYIDAEDADIARSLRMLGHPEENGIAIGLTPFHVVCRQFGVRQLFSGFGGDEAVSHPGAPLRRELRDQRQWRALFDILPGALPARLLRLLRAGVTGLPSAQGAGRPGTVGSAPLAKLDLGLVPAAAVQALGLDRVLREHAQAREDCRRINDAVLQHGVTGPHVASRLEACTLMAASHGLSYQWPLLDVRLVQQYLSTPSIEKVGPHGVGRYLHRRAISPLVPADIAWRSAKGTHDGRQLAVLGLAAQQQAAARLRQLQADLHPQLRDLLDLPRLCTRMAPAAAGQMSTDQAFVFQRLVRHLRWLDAWLHDLDRPAVAGVL